MDGFLKRLSRGSLVSSRVNSAGSMALKSSACCVRWTWFMRCRITGAVSAQRLLFA
jgi:hypothetical protein